jgi:glycosyltransferase involved in cell wall biosynthesis
VNVGLNALHLVPGETGGSELYARRLIGAVAATEPSFRLTVFASRLALSSLEEERWPENVELVGVAVDPRSRPRRVLAEQTILPRTIRRRRMDLLHNLFSTAPVAPCAPQVTTIHDVIYKRFPETHAGLLGHGLAALVWVAARRSERVITVSEAAKGEIRRFLDVPEDRIDVTYEGPAVTAGNAIPEQSVRDQLELDGSPIILTVSAKRPHKNLERLFEAFARVRSDPPPVLVVPGYATFYEKTLRQHAAAIGPGERIRFAGWLSDELLDGLYRAATCFVFPSLAEGFGLPVLDALVRGTPTACSNASSLPEVAGDAVLYFDPIDVGEMTRAIERLLADAALRERLRRAGPEQARTFTWERTAQATLASYDRALRG